MYSFLYKTLIQSYNNNSLLSLHAFNFVIKLTSINNINFFRYACTKILQNDIIPTNFLAKFNVTQQEGIGFTVKVRTEIGNMPCIYMWYDNKTGRSYIGQSSNLQTTIRNSSNLALNLRSIKEFKSLISAHILLNHLDNFTLYVLADCTGFSPVQMSDMEGLFCIIHRPTLVRGVRGMTGTGAYIFNPIRFKGDDDLFTDEMMAFYQRSSVYSSPMSKSAENSAVRVANGTVHHLQVFDYYTREFKFDFFGLKPLAKYWGITPDVLRRRITKKDPVEVLIDGKKKYFLVRLKDT